jgi:hypothetical protein
LAPYDFSLFWGMKSQLKGHNFKDVPEIYEQLLTILHVIPKSQVQQCFKQ